MPASRSLPSSRRRCPARQGLPVQFVIKSTDDCSASSIRSAQALLAAALKSGKFIFLQSDLKIDQPQANVVIDRDKAAELGLNMADVGAALAEALGGGYVNYFSLDGRSYKVIPQVQRSARLNVADLNNYYVTSVERHQRAALGDRARSRPSRDSGIDQPFPAAEFRDHPGRAGARREPGGRRCRRCRSWPRRMLPPSDHDRLRRADAAVRAAEQRLHRHLRLRA